MQPNRIVWRSVYIFCYRDECMMNFYDNYCEHGTLCQDCRKLEQGRDFRRSFLAAFPELPAEDFPCPQGKPWTHSEPAKDYAAIRAEILAAPDIEPWTLLREELRLTEAAVELHPEHDECWKNKQRQRIVGFYNTAKQKMKAGKPAP